MLHCLLKSFTPTLILRANTNNIIGNEGIVNITLEVTTNTSRNSTDINMENNRALIPVQVESESDITITT